MKSGYDQFFKNAKRAADGGKAQPAVTTSFSKKASAARTSQKSTSLEMAHALRGKMRPQAKRKPQRPTPWKFITLSMMGLAMAGVGLWKIDTIEHVMKNIEITMLGSAHAESAPAAAPKATEAKAEAAPAKTEYSQEDINHFSKLNERKRELDAREEELNRAEGELQAQRAELEKKLSELESTRRNISSVLEEKVKTDDAKVETLVQMYSNMKAQQAAKVFETMDENLAIEILGRMKKKNAAEIMGFVKAEKVQTLTEKFAGYKN